MKFRKKPVIIEAMQWDGFLDVTENSLEAIALWCDESWADENQLNIEGDIVIPTLEGNMVVQKNDWIIRGIKGEFYPCKPDIFEATYEPVDEN